MSSIGPIWHCHQLLDQYDITVKYWTNINTKYWSSINNNDVNYWTNMTLTSTIEVKYLTNMTWHKIYSKISIVFDLGNGIGQKKLQLFKTKLDCMKLFE